MPWRSRRPTTPLPDRLDCRQVERVLQAFLDGELRPTDAEVVTDHLRECERCGFDARVVAEVIAAIRRQRPDLDARRLGRLTDVADALAAQHPGHDGGGPAG